MNFSGKTILLVEDSMVIALSETLWLKKAGFKVIHVASGQEAVETVLAAPSLADLILMDINLGPGIDGIQAADEITKANNIPVIFLSSHCEKEIIERAEQISSYGFLTKDTKEAVILSAIKTAFRLHDANKKISLHEEKLKEHELWLNESQSLAKIANYEFDFRTRLWSGSRALSIIMGIDGIPFINIKEWSLLLHPEDREMMLDYYRKCKEDKSLFNREYRIIRPSDGRTVWVHGTGRFKLDPDGQPLIMYGTLQDITERKKAEDLIFESEKRYRQLFDEMMLACTLNEIVLDEYGKPVDFLTLDVNSEFQRIIGVTKEQVLGKSVLQVMPEIEPHWIEMFGQVALSGKPTRYMQHLSSINKYFEGYAFCPKKGYFCVTFADVTESRQSEEAFKKNEERYRRLFQNAWIGIFHSLPEGRFLKVNPTLARMMGYSSPEEMVRLVTNIPQQIYVESRKHAFLLTEIDSKDGWTYTENIYRRKDGSLMTANLAIRKELNPDGSIAYLEGYVEDITERKQYEQQLEKYALELRSSNAAKDKLFSIIAHDLKGPFSGFMGLTETLANSADKLEKKEISQFASVMYMTSKKIYELLTNLLDWSRLQTGNIEFRPEEIDLFSEVENIRCLFSSSAESKSIEIKNEVDAKLAIIADQKMLSVLLRNLVSNGIKFTGRGGRILIKAKKSDGFAEISVSDSGTGMTEEVLNKVFQLDSGYTTRGTDGEEGSGLGLVLCKELIEKGGGSLKIISNPGKGTEFYFTIPQ